ncbi:MAG: flagellar biosynthesis protein FliR [Hyphomicrobiaceae bacterium]|nr:MAG: flagellar biosynthesis protein FliR [Hyphomicrobiaceae bacterium]
MIGPDTVLLAFVLFCRIGGCLMLMPGFSSSRIPVQVRLFVAVAITLALAPVLVPVLQKALPDLSPQRQLALLVSETMVGALVGLMGRLFFMALQFMATAAAMFIGFGTMPGAPIEDSEPVPAFATIVTLTATVLFFLTEQHWEVLRALLGSYSALPVTEFIAIEFSLGKLTDALSSAFLLALQVSSPFIVYALIINLTVGIASKLVPQIPVYFISLPFVLAGGLIMLYFTIGETLRLFVTGFMAWLAAG